MFSALGELQWKGMRGVLIVFLSLFVFTLLFLSKILAIIAQYLLSFHVNKKPRDCPADEEV